jgi:PAS domain S-box-containing protein
MTEEETGGDDRPAARAPGRRIDPNAILTTRTPVRRCRIMPLQAAPLLAAIVESSDDAIATKDLNGTITSWNAAATRLFGYSAQEIIGRNIRVIIPPDRLDEEEFVLSRVRSGLSVNHFETVRLRKDGTTVDVSITVSPVRDRRGCIIGVSKIARDISSLKRALEDARRANQLKDEFLAILSHELRTPLNAIMGWAGLLSTSASDAMTRRAAGIIQRNTHAQARLVDDLLDVSRIVSGTLVLAREAADLRDLASAAVEDMRPLASAKSINLRLVGEIGGAPATVSGDAARLQQIIWNLLSNAVKFTPPRGHVTVTIRREAETVELAVADSGQGIDPAFLPHVFERFRQGDPSTTRQHRGLGLGLSIASQLTAAHGGTIAADSEGLDRGATFTVRLPAAPAPAHPPAPTDAASREFRLDGLRALVVDDEPDAATALALALEHRGADVTTCLNAAEALAAIDGTGIDVLLADIGMPRMDGYELMRRVRASAAPERWPRVAIAVTAYAGSAVRARVFEAGFDAHVQKPVPPERVIAIVAQVLTLRDGQLRE